MRLWRAGAVAADKKALGRLVEADRQVARAQVARLQELERDHQAAIRDPAALRADQGPRHLHHDRSRPAPDVGGAVLPFRGAEPLDDLGRARHHGLWPAGGGRRADGASEVAGHRHRRRGLGADDHAGDVDGGAVRPADQDLHPQQPVHGHGAAVAGTAARRALFAIAIPRRCRISSSSPRPITRVGIRCEKPGDLDDAIREMIEVKQAGDLRLRGRSGRELLPDDPVRPRPQRDDARRRRRDIEDAITEEGKVMV